MSAIMDAINTAHTALADAAAQAEDLLRRLDAATTDLAAMTAERDEWKRKYEEATAPPPPPPPPPVDVWWEVVAAAGVKVRSAPDLTLASWEATSRAVLKQGAKVREMERRDEWVRHDGGWSKWTHNGEELMQQVQTVPAEPVEPPAIDPPNPAETLLPHGYALVGVGTADPAEWQITPRGVQALRDMRAEAVLLMCPGCTQTVFDRVRAANPDMFIAVRLTHGMGNEAITPERFANDVREHLRIAYNNGVRYVQVANEPNAPVEGFGKSWSNGWEFGKWYDEVVALLAPEFPEALWGLPCPSPDASFQGAQGFHVFLGGALEYLKGRGNVDWFGLHVYWASPAGRAGASEAVTQFAKDHPGSFILVTEYSRQVGTDKANKGREYRDFVSEQYPGEVKATFGFVLEASAGWESETWAGSEIPAIVGARQVTATAKVA